MRLVFEFSMTLKGIVIELITENHSWDTLQKYTNSDGEEEV